MIEHRGADGWRLTIQLDIIPQEAVLLDSDGRRKWVVSGKISKGTMLQMVREFTAKHPAAVQLALF